MRYDPNMPRIVVGRDAAILWFDATMAVVWKPAHMLAVPAAGRQDTNNVLRFVGQRFGTALAVHRLDEETSGLMMIARTEKAQEALKARLEAHEVERAYLALVKGVFPTGDAKEFRTTIVRDRGDGKRGSIGTFDPETRRRYGDQEGKLAVTWIRALERAGKHTLVEARLETGRTHQVRIHLAECGHPVLGDPIYADRGIERMSPRLALHAARLAFVHPFTGVKHAFEAPLADDLEMLRRRLVDNRNEPAHGKR